LITCGSAYLDAQAALLFVAVFLGEFSDVADLAKHITRHLDDFRTHRRDVRQVLSAAGKNLDTEFIFEQSDLLADAGLGGKEALGSRGNVQIVVRDFPDVPELLQFHTVSPVIKTSGDSSFRSAGAEVLTHLYRPQRLARTAGQPPAWFTTPCGT